MTAAPQLVPSRIDDMMQVIAQRQTEIPRLGGAIALQVKVSAIRVAKTMLLDKRIRNVQRYDQPAVEKFPLHTHIHVHIAGRSTLWIGPAVEQKAAGDIP